MKKSMAVMTALAVGVSCCSAGMVTIAAQKEDGIIEKNGNLQKEYVLGENSPSRIDWEKALQILNESASGDLKMDKEIWNLEEEKKQEDLPDGEEEKTNGNQPDESKAGSGIESLQMPQKLEIVIDPWETDGKGQVYSEQYMIRNIGEETGILNLSNLTCKPWEKSGAVIREDEEGIHEGERKSIYMEILFGTGERIVLSEDGTEYEVELKPGEELSIQFTGEVNEYAVRGWENGDVIVGAVYSWETKEKTEESGDPEKMDEEEAGVDTEGEEDVSGDALTEGSGETDQPGDVSAEEPGKTEKSGDVQEEESGMAEKSGDISATETIVEEEGLPRGTPVTDENISAEQEQHKAVGTVDLAVSKEEEIRVDSWTADENGQTAEAWYVLRNEGESPGILKLSNLKCEALGQGKISVRTKPGSEASPPAVEEPVKELKDMGEKAVYIELLPEEAGEMDGTAKVQGDFEYKVELEPGEGLAVCFTNRLNEIILEELKEEKAAVTVSYAWIPAIKE